MRLLGSQGRYHTDFDRKVSSIERPVAGHEVSLDIAPKGKKSRSEASNMYKKRSKQAGSGYRRSQVYKKLSEQRQRHKLSNKTYMRIPYRLAKY